MGERQRESAGDKNIECTSIRIVYLGSCTCQDLFQQEHCTPEKLKYYENGDWDVQVRLTKAKEMKVPH